MSVKEHLRQVHGLARGEHQAHEGHDLSEEGAAHLHKIDHDVDLGDRKAWQHSVSDHFLYIEQEDV